MTQAEHNQINGYDYKLCGEFSYLLISVSTKCVFCFKLVLTDCVCSVRLLSFILFCYETLLENNRTIQLALCLEKAMYARAISRSAGSETRGEDIKRGKVLVTISKPLVAQRAGGITLRCMSAQSLSVPGRVWSQA